MRNPDRIFPMCTLLYQWWISSHEDVPVTMIELRHNLDSLGIGFNTEDYPAALIITGHADTPENRDDDGSLIIDMVSTDDIQKMVTSRTGEFFVALAQYWSYEDNVDQRLGKLVYNMSR